jgi:hypothetical protein
LLLLSKVLRNQFPQYLLWPFSLVPLISLYVENSLGKHIGFTFGLNEMTLLGGRGKKSHLDHLPLKEAGESDDQKLFLPWMHLLQNHWGDLRVFLWRQQNQNATILICISPKGPPSSKPRQSRFL